MSRSSYMFKIASNTEQFSLEVSGGPELRVVRFSGRESISQLYSYQLELASPDAEIDFEDIIGKTATLSIKIGEVPRYVHGVLCRFEEIDIATRIAVYRATLVPAVWRFQHRHDCRIFQNMAVPDIISAVLDEAGLPSDQYSLDIQGAHPTREYCVQYRESDWSFVSRLMEEEGIFYYFDHAADQHILVMSDTSSVHAAIQGTASIVYRPPRGQVQEEEHVAAFRFSREIRAGKSALRDFNFKTPAMDLSTSAEGAVHTDLEIYDYPGLYEQPGPGGSLSTIRLQEQQALVKLARGDSACARLIPGSLFTLSEHPRTDFNREYLLVEIEQAGSQPQVLEHDAAGSASEYSNKFACIPSDVPFRPARRTPKPVVRGVQTAIVVGPGSEEIYTDEHGRVKVQFHWDRRGTNNEESSCWIRVSQVWAGQGWGAMWIPRIGHEVIVDFLEGDPDRPIITGRVYHGTNVPPYELPGEKTKSTIKSNSSLGGGGSNEIRFEDAAGSEEIFIHGQKDWTIAIENDKNQTIGHDETLDVGNNRTKTVGVDQSETIGSNKTISVGANHDETIGANKTISVGANHDETIGANMTVTVAAMMTETVGVNSAETVGVAKELTIGGVYSVTVGAAMSETVVANKSITVGGARKEDVTGPASTSAQKILIEAAEEIVLKTGTAKIVMKKNGDITIDAGGAFKVVSKKDTSVKATGKMVLKGQKISEN